MSKYIEVSEQDYARIQHAADADGMPMGAWVVENLPLARNGTEPADAPLCANGKPAKTMADLFAGRVGVVNSGGAERLSSGTAKFSGRCSRNSGVRGGCDPVRYRTARRDHRRG